MTVSELKDKYHNIRCMLMTEKIKKEERATSFYRCYFQRLLIDRLGQLLRNNELKRIPGK